MNCYYFKYARFNEKNNMGYGFSDNIKYDQEVLKRISNYIEQTVQNEKRDFLSFFCINNYMIFTYSSTGKTFRIDSEIKIGVIDVNTEDDRIDFSRNFINIKDAVSEKLINSFEDKKIEKLSYSPSNGTTNKSLPICSKQFMADFIKAVFITSMGQNVKLMINYDEKITSIYNSTYIENLVYNYILFPTVIKSGFVGKTQSPPELSGMKFYFNEEDATNKVNVTLLEEKNIFIVNISNEKLYIPKTDSGYIDRIIKYLDLDALVELISSLNVFIFSNNLYKYSESNFRYYEAIFMYKALIDKNEKWYPTASEKNNVMNYLKSRSL